jgi:nucleotide-binding universal stress UspA family protein
MILICYDGSEDSRAAIEQATELLGDEQAVVLTVWEPFVAVIARTTLGFGAVGAPDAEDVDEATRKSAEERAEEGAELARKAGMDARPRARSQATTTGRAILAEADAVGASAIVMGSRGLTGLKSLLLGSVSHEVIQQADRTVVVVPSPQVAARRAREVHGENAS